MTKITLHVTDYSNLSEFHSGAFLQLNCRIVKDSICGGIKTVWSIERTIKIAGSEMREKIEKEHTSLKTEQLLREIRKWIRTHTLNKHVFIKKKHLCKFLALLSESVVPVESKSAKIEITPSIIQMIRHSFLAPVL